MQVRTVRTRLLQTVVTMSLAAFSFQGAFVPQTIRADAPDEFDALRAKWAVTLTGGRDYDPADPEIALKLNSMVSTVTKPAGTGYWDLMNKTAGRAYLWSDLTSTTVSSDLSAEYERLYAMARAYAAKGSSLEGNAALRDDIVGALDWLYDHQYNENSVQYDNWYHWQIGVPISLNNIMTLMYADLSAAQIAKYSAAINKFSPAILSSDTGANRVWRATVLAVNGVITKNGAKIAAGRDGLSQVFEYVTSGDGFYEDGSFIQHNKHPYNGGYGKALLDQLSTLLFLLNDSSWDVTDPNRQHVYRWVYDSFEPFIYNGAIMDMVRGREVSRKASYDHAVGRSVMNSILRLSQSAPPSDKYALQSMVKYWIAADTYQNFLAYTSIEMIGVARAVYQDASIIPRGEKIAHKQFPAMDRAVHLRPGFGLGLSMSSNRTYKYEAINGENLKGWYTGDGMTLLYNGDLAHYTEDYWATVNPYRLPGTTVDTRPRAAETIPWGTDYVSPKTWTGGTSMDGLYGVAGMDLDAYGSDLTAHKSWFMFDDEVVAIGAGITSKQNYGIETTVENRRLNSAGSDTLTVNGTVKPSNLGWSETNENVEWMHLAGHTPGSDIGYYFPGRSEVKALREARTGSWSDINSTAQSLPSVTRNYMNIWLDHGTNPTDGSYAYVLLPNKSASQTAAYSSNPDIEILKNTNDVQAVKERALGLTAVNFWKGGRAGFISSYQPASVMVKEAGSEITLSVSDPTQRQSKLTLELSKVGLSVISRDPAITVLNTTPNIKVQINTAGSMGKTHTVKLSYDPAAAGSQPIVTNVAPSADAYVESGSPSNNYGLSTIMAVSSASSNTRQSFLKFDLNAVPGQVESAVLNVYGSVTDSKGGSKLQNVYAVSGDSWIESGGGGITWSNKPAFGAVIASVYAEPPYQWLSADVTAYTAAEQQGDKIAGFGIGQTGSALYTTLYSKENAQTTKRPYLNVTSYSYIGPQLDGIQASAASTIMKVGDTTPIAVVGILEDGSSVNVAASSATYASDRPDLVAVSSSGVATAIQPGRAVITVTATINGHTASTSLIILSSVNGMETVQIAPSDDSFVLSGSPNQTNGASTTLAVTSNTGNIRQSYMKFDLNGVTGTVYSATLMVYAKNTDSKGGIKENKLYALNDDQWSETGLTWNNKPADGSLITSTEIDTTWQWRELDVTGFVQSEYAGDKTAGFVMKQDGPGLFITINSKENAGNKPYLKVRTYDTGS